MSFQFGSFDSDSLDLIATLNELPSLGGLQVEYLEAPGTDGVLLGGTTRTAVRFEFDVIIRGGSREDVVGKADALAAALDPMRGEQDLVIDAVPGWYWRSVASAQIDWSRLTWDPGLGYQLRAPVAFDALEAYGRPLVDESWQPNGNVTRGLGNAVSYPTIEVEGQLTASQSVTLTVGAVDVTVQGPLASGQVMRLDYDRFEFARWNGAAKVASVVRGMSTLDRPELWPNQETPFAVSSTGTITRCELFANSRRQ